MTTTHPECLGHKTTSGPIGHTYYCDGSCHTRRVSIAWDGLYRWHCGCGDYDNGYLTRDYAIDGWRETHDLEPLTNHPQV